jgi:hypothetical protein
MSNVYVEKDTQIENEKEIENENGFDNNAQQQVPQEDVIYINELPGDQYSLMDIVEHRDKPTWTLDFMRDRRIETTHRFKKEEDPAQVTYFPVTLQHDPDYKRWYKVTSKKLRRAIINRYLATDKRRLEITRVGSGKNTIHRVRAVDDVKVLVIPTNEPEFFEDVPLQQQKLSQ